MLTDQVTADDMNRGIPFDFNKIYEGYYPRCSFTVLEHVLGAYRLAGTDPEGVPHLFTSFTGGTWEETSLVMQTPYGISRSPRTSVVSILGEETEGQIYLVCEGGEIVIIPDCPKCVRIISIVLPQGVRVVTADFSYARYLEDERKAEGRDQSIRLYLSDGMEKTIALQKLRQYRVSVSFAKKLITEGATVIDVREDGNYPDADMDEIGKTYRIPMEELSKRLSVFPQNSVLLFLCRTGRLSDYAAEYARKNGYSKAYSIGGTESWAHMS